MAQIRELCSKNIFFWINMFCYTHDPRKSPSTIPMDLYDFQYKVVEWILRKINNQEDGLVEKSRDMGASWLFVYVFQWLWQFGDPGNDFLIGSRKREFVDEIGNLDTLFEKIRFNLRKQPYFLMPPGFDWKTHDNFMRLVNPKTGSYIKGESCNVYFGSGGRYKSCLLDEFSKWDNKDFSAWKSLGDTTRSRFPVSSANGKNNHFYELREQRDAKIDVLTLLWKLHPEKNQEWYEAEKARRSKEELAQEVDIDYSASVKNKAAENFNANIHVLQADEWEYDPYSELELSMDFNVDPMCWLVSESQKSVDITFKEYTEDTTVTENVITKFCQDFAQHKNKTVYLYGDRSGRSRSTQSRFTDYQIIKSVLKNHGWKYYDYTFIKNPYHSEVINTVNKRFRDHENNNKAWEFILYSCVSLIDSLESTQAKDNQLVKDGIEHHFQAFGYRIAKKYPVKKREIKTHQRR